MSLSTFESLTLSTLQLFDSSHFQPKHGPKVFHHSLRDLLHLHRAAEKFGERCHSLAVQAAGYDPFEKAQVGVYVQGEPV